MIWRNAFGISTDRSSPLSRWTTLGVGGPAEVLAFPSSVEQCSSLLADCAEADPTLCTCEVTSCGAAGTCVDVANGALCVCGVGYMGNNCDACAVGFASPAGESTCYQELTTTADEASIVMRPPPESPACPPHEPPPPPSPVGFFGSS